MPQNKFFLALGISLLFSAIAWAQSSIVEKLIEIRPAIVQVQAQITGVVKSPTQQAVRDPKTGRILIIRNAGLAAVERHGGGVIIHPDGIIATNAHTVDQANVIKVSLDDNTTLAAKIIRFDPKLDLCLLKVTPTYNLTSIPLADSNLVKLGDDIYTIGTSPEAKETLSGGKVIGLATTRSTVHTGKYNDLIQTTVNLYKGDSGGPLLDRRGNLIGLMTAKDVSADHSSFAIPSSSIAVNLVKYFEELKEKNEQPVNSQ